MSEPVRYVTNDRGDRVGVLLDLEVYQRLVSPLMSDPDCLIGLSLDELQALAHCKLAATDQIHLDDLLARNGESQLPADEIIELDCLLAETDQLTILKARAQYTLKRLNELTKSA